MRQQLDKHAARLQRLVCGGLLLSATATKHERRKAGTCVSPSALRIAVVSHYQVKLLPLFGQQPVLYIQSPLSQPMPSSSTSLLRQLRTPAGQSLRSFPRCQNFYCRACWCDAGECSVLVNWEDNGSLLRVSTYWVDGSACHLLGTWVTECAHFINAVDLHVTAGAAEIYLMQRSGSYVLPDNVETSVRVCSPTEIVCTHHMRGRLSWHYAQDSGLVGLTFSALHLFSSAGMHSVDLGHLPTLSTAQSEPEAIDETAAIDHVLHSCAAGSWDSLAVVWRLNRRHTSQQQLLFVDLAQKQKLVWQRVDSMNQPLSILHTWPNLQIAVGRCSVALAGTTVQVVSVRATAGPCAGTELFCINAAHPSFEPLSGLLLAVATLAGGLSVLHGVTGIQMAIWPAPGPSHPILGVGVCVCLQWLPDASGVLIILHMSPPKWEWTRFRTIMF